MRNRVKGIIRAAVGVPAAGLVLLISGAAATPVQQVPRQLDPAGPIARYTPEAGDPRQVEAEMAASVKGNEVAAFLEEREPNFSESRWDRESWRTVFVFKGSPSPEARRLISSLDGAVVLTDARLSASEMSQAAAAATHVADSMFGGGVVCGASATSDGVLHVRTVPVALGGKPVAEVRARGSELRQALPGIVAVDMAEDDAPSSRVLRDGTAG